MKLSKHLLCMQFPKLHVEPGGGRTFVVHAVLHGANRDIVFNKYVLHYKHTLAHTP